MATVHVDGNSLPADSRSKLHDWLGLTVGGHVALSLHSSNDQDQFKIALLWWQQDKHYHVHYHGPHRSTMYVDAAYCYRWSSVVCRSVSQSVCHNREPCKNGWIDQDAICDVDSDRPREPRIRLGCTLAPYGECDWIVHVLRRCGLCQVTLTTCYYYHYYD